MFNFIAQESVYVHIMLFELKSVALLSARGEQLT